MSKTNAFLYHTFEHYIGQGHRVEMWGYEIPRVLVSVGLPSGAKEIAAKVAHAYEADVLDIYEKEVGHFPVLSDNSDPTHRKEKKKMSPEKEEAKRKKAEEKEEVKRKKAEEKKVGVKRKKTPLHALDQ
jgi:hypothetical protein